MHGLFSTEYVTDILFCTTFIKDLSFMKNVCVALGPRTFDNSENQSMDPW